MLLKFSAIVASSKCQTNQSLLKNHSNTPFNVSSHVLLLDKEDQINKDLQIFMERFKFKDTDQIATKNRNEINYTRGKTAFRSVIVLKNSKPKPVYWKLKLW